MSEDVKRYKVEELNCCFDADMIESDQGGYVEYADYAKLKDEIERLRIVGGQSEPKFVLLSDYLYLKSEVERLENNCDYLDQKLDEEIDKSARLAGHINKLLAHQEWQPISTYKGGNWAYLFVPLDNIPGNYVIVEGCFMVGLKKWWIRSWKDTDRDAKIIPTHWMPLFVPPEVGD